MPREKENFREQMQSLMDKFPGREVLTLKETAQLLGVCTRTITSDSSFPAKKLGGTWVVPMVGLARWLS